MTQNSTDLTLEQIGKQAGVSRSTVSRVLNDHPDVRSEVRARVKAVIEDTGYMPNQAARALVSSRTGLIGLVMLTEVDELFGDPYYSALVKGIQLGCLDHGLIFSIFPVHGPEGPSDVLTTQIAQGFIDGVIVTAGPRSDRLVSRLRARNKRLVVVGHPVDDVDVLRVDVENRAGSATAVKHLLDLGRSRVGFIGPSAEYLYGTERFDGYKDALAAAGREVDDVLIRFEDPTTEGGYRAASTILPGDVDAIHVATDPMAVGVFRSLTERGVRIPHDVAIVGFDGLDRGPQLEPSLTTVVQPVTEVGRMAVALLANDSPSTEPIILPTSLRIGGSCGASDFLHNR
ncbi:MAG: LacI family DNA-binding transcriptional regulator [Acidimicrobiales bacterium]|nr:LacI family DNA-binding transcriptional regulator [Acidimicrobiales bacterium]